MLAVFRFSQQEIGTRLQRCSDGEVGSFCGFAALVMGLYGRPGRVLVPIQMCIKYVRSTYRAFHATLLLG
jgi:hypothetical protein